ncbi:hypothetical protein [Winslowiella toletana]|uniref:hypothetical protein n=1 Tax=Winslowiella toletana TaxID=92490 RepID=UPI0028BE80AE|nr:hypothetical protein [Winslowiella toletana]WNN46713.1 hypothetical protein RIN69_22575 [Winslowiella toletana]
MKLITKKSSKVQYERRLSREECDAVFNVFGRLRDFIDKEKDIALILICEMKENQLVLQCDCNDNIPALSALNKGYFLRKVAYGGFLSHSCPLFLLESRTTWRWRYHSP